MAQSSNKTRVLHFRVAEADFAEIDQKLKACGMTASEFFRDVFLNAKINFKVKEIKPRAYHQLLYIYNKAGNNINQLAHAVNSSHRRGVISDAVYTKWLNKLASIESLLLAGVSDAD